jgi:SAM-dependent methyltransferase
MASSIDRAVRDTNDKIFRLNLEDAIEKKRFESDMESGERLISMGYENFWDAESLNWHKRINKKEKDAVRKLIGAHIRGLTLNLGSGSYNYGFDWIICLDFSWYMLSDNKSYMKIFFNLEKPILPLKTNQFDTIISAFAMNYIMNISQLTKEMDRILKAKGQILIFQCPLNEWYKKKSLHSEEEIIMILSKRFKIKHEKFDKITFIRAEK